VEQLVMWSRELKPKRLLDSGASDST
jgi:hypothetical protein